MTGDGRREANRSAVRSCHKRCQNAMRRCRKACRQMNEPIDSAVLNNMTSMQCARAMEQKALRSTDKHPLGYLLVHGTVVGQLLRVHGPGEFISPANQRPVMSAVLELEGGHSFTFDAEGTAATWQEKFQELTSQEIKFMLGVVGALDGLIHGSVRLGASMRLDSVVGRRLLVAVLKRALGALGQGG